MSGDGSVVKVYQVPTFRWTRLVDTLFYVVVAIFCLGFLALFVASLAIKPPPKDLPPLWAIIAMSLILATVMGGFIWRMLRDPLTLQISDEGLVAICPLKTWQVEWNEVDYVRESWGPGPVWARGPGGRGHRIAYPLIIHLKNGRFLRRLYLLSLCVSGQDTDLLEELQRRSKVGSC